MRCYVESPRSKTGKLLKTLLLKIVYQLVQPSGPIALRQGPLDVQCKLLKSMLDVDYSNADMTIAMSIFESTGVLVHSYFINVDKIKCINIGEKHNVVTTTFNEIFACVMGSDPIKMDLQVSTDVLFLRLLKFLGKLVQTQFRQTNSDQPVSTPRDLRGTLTNFFFCVEGSHGRGAFGDVPNGREQSRADPPGLDAQPRRELRRRGSQPLPQHHPTLPVSGRLQVVLAVHVGQRLSKNGVFESERTEQRRRRRLSRVGAAGEEDLRQEARAAASVAVSISRPPTERAPSVVHTPSVEHGGCHQEFPERR
jgi:hypothetical protein